MRIKPEQIEGALSKKLAPVYLVSGDEPLQVGEVADAIRLAAKNAGYTTREVYSVEKGFEWNELAVAADSFSIFADKKIIDLRMSSAKPGAEGGKAFSNYCQRIPEDTLLLITLPKVEKATQKSKWFQAIDNSGVVVQVWALEGGALINWLQRRSQKRGLQIDSTVIKGLASRVEGNLLAASQEIEKLYVLYGSKPITKQMLEDAVTDNSRYDVFKLTDCVLAGRASRAVKILSALKAEAMAAPVIVWALSREARLLINIQTAINQGQNKDVVFRSFRLWEKRAQLINAAISRKNLKDFQEIIVLSAKADRQVKGQETGDYWETLLAVCLLFSAS